MSTEVPLPPSLAEHVRKLVEADILAGHLSPSTRVTETELARRYSVSRTPVREALRVLVNQGLVVRRGGSAVYVAPNTRYEEVDVIYRVRYEIEGFLTAEAAKKFTTQGLELVGTVHKQFLNSIANADDRSDVAELADLDTSFHWAIYSASDSNMTGIVRSYWSRIQRELARVVYESSSPHVYARQHQLILEALTARDVDKARKEMVEHIKYSNEVLRNAFHNKEGIAHTDFTNLRQLNNATSNSQMPGINLERSPL